MASTSARMLRLLSFLQNQRHWPGTELADRLGVSERTLRRDIDRLRELGYPVDATRGVAGGYQLRSGAAMPPLLLDDEEAVAIAVGLRSAAGGAIAGIEDASIRALTKVIQVMPRRLRRRVEALQAYTARAVTRGPAVDAVALTTIAQACRDRERIRFTYTAGSGEQSTRLVEPHQLVSLRTRWYLLAWDVERGDWRTFRIDRLAAPAATGGWFRPREVPGGDPAVFVRDQVESRPTQYEVVVGVQAPAAEVTEVTRYTGGAVEPVGDRSCRIRINVDDFAWPVLILATVGAPFDVEGPAEFRDYLRTTGELLLRG